MNRTSVAGTVVAVTLSFARQTVAQETDTREAPAPTTSAADVCAGRLTPDTVVRCAWANSPDVKQARHELAAIAGRRIAAGVWLPSNPVIAATAAQRRRPWPPAPLEASAFNWSVTLSQEIEIAGQRGARLEVADAEASAQVRRVAVAEQEVAAGALAAFYEAAAAKEQLALAEMMTQTGKALATLAEARAKEALMSGVEADVARAEATRIALIQLEAQRRSSAAGAALALLLGRSDGKVNLPVLAEVPVLATAKVDAPGLEQHALRLRGEVGAAEMERRVLEGRLTLLRRERIPNLTISAFAEKGEINDRILGVGLSLPVPLPAPVGRTRAGEIAETLASIHAAQSSIERVKRRVRLEVTRAVAEHNARTAAGGLFAGDLLQRARADLAALREALSTRQLAMREVVVWQRSLLELLQTEIESRLARALSWAELRRVTGMSFVNAEGGAR